LKRGKVNRTSVPAVIIMVCVALGIGLFAWYGKPAGGMPSLQDNFFVSGITGDSRNLLTGTPVAPVALQLSAAMDSGNVASWIKPAVASVYFRETRLETVGMGANARQREIQVTQKLGSGVVVHPSGYILTNNHLVEAADTILVNVTGFSAPKEAKIAFVDPKSDLCILKIDVEFPLPVVGIHRANHLLPGEEVIAVSLNPDLSGEARRAMVSNVKRDILLNGKSHTDLIALDRKLGASFDGSPLVDRNGLVVGLLGPAADDGSAENKSFAVSTKSIHRFLARFMEKAEFPVLVNRRVPTAGPSAQAVMVRAGLVREAPLITESNSLFWMGINYQNLEPAQAKQYDSPFPKGAMVNFVHPFGPAVESDIQPGDIILKANGRIVRGAGDIETVVRKARGGDITLQLFRQGKRMEIKVPTAPNPTVNRMVNVNAQTMPNGLAGMGGMQRGVDMDRVMADQKKMMIIKKFGLDRSLINQRIDGDRLIRIARDQMIARKLGIDPQLMMGRGTNRDSAIRNMLHRELASRLGIDPAVTDVVGFGREQLTQIAKTRILAEKLEVDAAMASLPGVTAEEIIQSAINSYIGAKLSLTAGEAETMTLPARQQTAPNAPTTQTEIKKDMDRLMKRQRMEQMVSQLGLSPNLLLIPGMSLDRMVKIAGNRYLAAKLGLDPAVTSMPGIDRERIVQMGLKKQFAKKLALPGSVADRPQMTADGLLRIAENRILAGKLGLSSDVINMPGIGRDRIIRIAGDRLMSSVWTGGVN